MESVEKSPRSEPPLKKAKEETPKTDNVKSSSSSQRWKDGFGTPERLSKPVKEHQGRQKPVKEEKVKKDYSKDIKSEKGTSKEEKSPGSLMRKVSHLIAREKKEEKTEEKSVDKDFESSSMKISKLEVTEIVKPSPKRKMGLMWKMDRTPEKDKISSSAAPAKKIKLNRETGKNWKYRKCM